MRHLNSPVFWRVIVCTLLGLFFILSLLWAYYLLERYQTLQDSRERLHEMSAEIEEYLEQGDLERVLQLASADESVLWSEEHVFNAFEDDELLTRIVTGDDETLAGFDYLDADPGYSTTHLHEHELDAHPLIALHTLIEAPDIDTLAEAGELSVIIARFYPEELLELAYQLRFGSILIAMSGLVLGCVSAYFAANLVINRLSGIREATASIVKSEFSHRIPTPGNVDEFDLLAQEINLLSDKSENLKRNVRDVSVGVAHDLKTPLSNISGRLQLIERDMQQADAVQVHVDAAANHINTLKRTLDALLRLGEVEDGKRKSEFSEVDLSDLTTDLADSFAPVFEEADKTLLVQIEPDILVTGDKDLITQLLINLLENVLEHARDGATAWLRLAVTDDKAQLQVEDDGPGIPESFADRVFERFYRMDASRGSSGNGLGLSLVKSIAQMHGGGVRLSHGKSGVMFTVELPLRNRTT